MWHADGPVMRGKTVIITGANSGIGFETSSEIARYGAKVILACRDMTRAENARKEIIERLKGLENQSNIEERIFIEQLDLASFDSIRAFADRMLKLDRLDVLINNAGVALLGERLVTKDGLEMTMGTNHFGHFLLTNLLLPLLKKSTPSRIVVVSSEAYKSGKLDFESLNSERSFSRFKSYADSKLANNLFTRELARRLEGTGVIVNCLHPGVVATEVGRHIPKAVAFLFGWFKFLMKTPLQGAQTTIFLATSNAPDALKTGLYFIDSRPQQLTQLGRDDDAAKRLWQISEQVTKLTSS